MGRLFAPCGLAEPKVQKRRCGMRIARSWTYGRQALRIRLRKSRNPPAPAIGRVIRKEELDLARESGEACKLVPHPELSCGVNSRCSQTGATPPAETGIKGSKSACRVDYYGANQAGALDS